MSNHFGKILILALLAIVTAYFSVNPQSAPLKTSLTLADIMAALGAIFIIVLLVERLTEIVISIWRQSAADSLKQEIESLAKDPKKASELLERSKRLATYQADTKSIALLVGFSISVVVCAAGIGLLDAIVDVSRGPKQFLRGVDIVLTSGLIAGGSDGFHKFVSALDTFFTESKKRMEGRT